MRIIGQAFLSVILLSGMPREVKLNSACKILIATPRLHISHVTEFVGILPPAGHWGSEVRLKAPDTLDSPMGSPKCVQRPKRAKDPTFPHLPPKCSSYPCVPSLWGIFLLRAGSPTLEDKWYRQRHLPDPHGCGMVSRTPKHAAVSQLPEAALCTPTA